MKINNPLSARVLYYYVNTRRWLSDLEFFQIEVSFLQGLLSDYFIRLTDDSDYCKKLKGLETKLFKLEKNIGKLNVQLHNHMHLIEQEARHSLEQEEALAARQVELDVIMPGLTKSYRDTKYELFNLVGTIIRENKFLIG